MIFFKRILYLKQINVITGGPLGAEGLGQLPPLPPLYPALHAGSYTDSPPKYHNLKIFENMAKNCKKLHIVLAPCFI